jgi:hypothetical protein
MLDPQSLDFTGNRNQSIGIQGSAAQSNMQSVFHHPLSRII